MTVSDEERWGSIKLLLHDDTIRLHARIAGLSTLLFAQPLTSICRMRTKRIDDKNDQIFITFDQHPIEMPPGLDNFIGERLKHRGNASYASRSNGWFFPGGIPRRPL